MPVKQLMPNRPTGYDQLVQELFDEWSRPNPGAKEPVILEERGRDGKLVHFYVVWSRWAHFDRIIRGEIMMDAAEKKLPQNELLEITIAMGLTPDEADQFGIQWR